MSTRWANVATLGKAKNLKGGLLAYARKGLSFLLTEGMEVAFVPPVLRVPRTGRVESISEVGQGAYLVQFDSIDSIDLAEALSGHSCLVRCDCLPDGALELAQDFVGFSVVTAAGEELGRVVALEENPAHALLVVKLTREGQPLVEDEKLTRIPLVDAFVTSVDEVAKTLTVNLPEGLLEL